MLRVSFDVAIFSGSFNPSDQTESSLITRHKAQSIDTDKKIIEEKNNERRKGNKVKRIEDRERKG